MTEVKESPVEQEDAIQDQPQSDQSSEDEEESQSSFKQQLLSR